VVLGIRRASQILFGGADCRQWVALLFDGVDVGGIGRHSVASVVGGGGCRT
jgi:hypothetical protein